MKLQSNVARLTVALVGALLIGSTAVGSETTVSLRLSPSSANPRNSEGDFVQLKDGRLLFVYTHFTSGAGDHASAYLAGRFSGDGGKSWDDTDTHILDNDADMNVMSVSLLRLTDGRIAMFYLRKNSTADCRPVVRYSSDETKTWSEPQNIVPDQQIGYYVLNNDRVIQLLDGRLVVPLCLHKTPEMEKTDWSGRALCYLSDDGGKSWRQSKTILEARDARNDKRWIAQEPGVVQLSDRRLMMFVRSDAGCQLISHSQDGGETWSPLVESTLRSPVSPASMERIPGSDTLLCVWNDHANIGNEQRGKRTPLSLALSKDDGKTWSSSLTLYDNPNGWYCYTAIEFTADAILLGHCAGDRTTNNGLAETQITRIPIDSILEQEQPLVPLRPFWKSEVVDQESVLFLQDESADESYASVLFPIDEIISVQSSSGDITYTAGVDYQFVRGTNKIVIPAGSRVVTTPSKALRRPANSQRFQLTHRDGNGEILFGAKLEYHRMQTSVTYRKADDEWPVAMPVFDETALPITLQKLRDHQQLSIVLLGDSISTGCNASGWGGGAPFQPAYQDLLKEHLQTHYKTDVLLTNLSVGGMSTPWGISMTDQVAGHQPDLVILAFGMNDSAGRSAKEYGRNTATMITQIREAKPDTEFILIATMRGNPDWTRLNHTVFSEYRDELAALCGPGIALADLTSVWSEFLKRKQDADITGNGVNHPNDFGHRVYAQVLSALLIE
ncbi:exo-alpha-sialidase [Stieleria varia]|uniref:Sialidase A n=1 Tax=Stieleria varia TaxID=2528005 RepID=A0A5C5ZX91_9BACT|nr:exo-alpha-sialidase [Stieleria varia]TWT91765.1 Sialidase A precursor [Stieleria varia]